MNDNTVDKSILEIPIPIQKICIKIDIAMYVFKEKLI